MTCPMPDRNQERAVLALFIESVRLVRSVNLAILRDNPADFPDFILVSPIDGAEIWVEIVQAVESVDLLAAERRAQRLYDVAASEYRARGEEVVLTVSPQGIESVTPSPGYGVTGVLVPGPARKILPSEWITKALEQKGRPNRYGPAERARTILLIDCSREVLITRDDAAEVHRDLMGNTLGFQEVWAASTCWMPPGALLLAP
jgi:hypothetical protein